MQEFYIFGDGVLKPVVNPDMSYKVVVFYIQPQIQANNWYFFASGHYVWGNANSSPDIETGAKGMSCPVVRVAGSNPYTDYAALRY